jgi:hypothetical protein
MVRYDRGEYFLFQVEDLDQLLVPVNYKHLLFRVQSRIEIFK